MPGLSDQFVSDDYATWWRSCNPGVPMPRQRDLIAGAPLVELKIDVSKELTEEWTATLEEQAAALRKFMLQEPARNTEGGEPSKVAAAPAHWKVPDAPTLGSKSKLGSGKLPPGKLPSDAPSVEVLDPVGLPVTPDCEELIQKVAYAPKCSSLSGYACAVKVPQQDFKRTLGWNTQLAPHEAQAITDPTASSVKKDQPQQVINNFIEKGRNKVVFKQLRDGVRASRDSLKCHLTTGAAAEAVQRATSLIDEGIRGAQERLGQLFNHLRQLGFLRGRHFEQSSLFRQIHTDLRQVTQGVGGLQQASHYLNGVSQAGTGAATRAVRLQMERFRTETVRGIFSIPESEQNSRLEQSVVRLPFTPSSVAVSRPPSTYSGRSATVKNSLPECRHNIRALVH